MPARLIVALTLLGSVPAWPIDRDRAALTSPDRPKLASGAEITAPAIMLSLLAPAAANLPTPPERAPKDGTFAGFAALKTSPKAGIYTVSLSSGAWVDVVQDGHILKPKASSGATDCDGIRKTMKYELAASPFVIQISGATENAIGLAVLPSE
jgi:hypothetical protein